MSGEGRARQVRGGRVRRGEGASGEGRVRSMSD